MVNFQNILPYIGLLRKSFTRHQGILLDHTISFLKDLGSLNIQYTGDLGNMFEVYWEGVEHSAKELVNIKKGYSIFT